MSKIKMNHLSKQLKRIDKSSECIVLIHGLARTARCMNKASGILSSYGYDIVNLSYPSRKKPVESLVSEHLQETIQNNHHYHKIHFMTHSMGAILLRFYLSKDKIPNLGRVVMLAPPNQGSELVDKLGHLRLFVYLNGPAGGQLGTDKKSLVKQLERVDFDLGILTGDISINPLLSMFISGPNDGKVSVHNAKVEGMRDFMRVAYSHSFIMQRKKVIQQALFYIQQGCFFR